MQGYAFYPQQLRVLFITLAHQEREVAKGKMMSLVLEPFIELKDLRNIQLKLSRRQVELRSDVQQ